MTNQYLKQLPSICQALFEADVDDGISTDELMMATGFTPEGVRDALHTLGRVGKLAGPSHLVNQASV